MNGQRNSAAQAAAEAAVGKMGAIVSDHDFPKQPGEISIRPSKKPCSDPRCAGFCTCGKKMEAAESARQSSEGKG